MTPGNVERLSIALLVLLAAVCVGVMIFLNITIDSTTPGEIVLVQHVSGILATISAAAVGGIGGLWSSSRRFGTYGEKRLRHSCHT